MALKPLACAWPPGSPFPTTTATPLADLDRLTAAARAAGATALITTEKDLVRLGKLAAAFPEPLPLKTARLRVEIENQSAAIDWLAGRLAPASFDPPL